MSATHPDFVHIYDFTVLEMHLDTFGHMNHATYFQMFEEARWDLITARGYGLDVIMKTKIGPTILGATIEYKRELKLREKIQIRTRVADYSKKVGTIHQQMVGPEGDIRCEVKLLFALFDMNKRKLITSTPEWRHAIGIE